jgi:hypothetical protein
MFQRAENSCNGAKASDNNTEGDAHNRCATPVSAASCIASTDRHFMPTLLYPFMAAGVVQWQHVNFLERLLGKFEVLAEFRNKYINISDI